MFDAPLGDFPLDGLPDWANPSQDSTATTKTRKRKRPGGDDPEWRQRQPGEPLDRSSPAYQKAAAAAQEGIPHFARLHWMQAQVINHGTRYSLKFEFVDGRDVAIEHCTRAGLLAMRRERFANLTTIEKFQTNCRKRRWRDAREGRQSIGQECWDVADAMVEYAEDYRAKYPDGPLPLLGWVSMTFRGEGTITYPGQFALVIWRQEDGIWLPIVCISQFCGDGAGGSHHLVIGLRLPSAINRDGTPRSAVAQSRYPFVGAWYSAALQERITTAREIKAMRDEDIRRRGGRA